MGYYVNTTRCTAVLPSHNKDEAYKIMCELNKHDELKGGGGWINGESKKWFSWMDENYPETCKDAGDILEMLGFELDINEDGDIHLLNYDNKTGQEDVFLARIQHLLTGSIEWQGEDGSTWVNNFGDDSEEVTVTIVTQKGNIPILERIGRIV